MKKIIDEFTDLRISRQYKYQLRRRKEGECILCGKKAVNRGWFCMAHYLKTSVANHKKYARLKGRRIKPSAGKWLRLARKKNLV